MLLDYFYEKYYKYFILSKTPKDPRPIYTFGSKNPWPKYYDMDRKLDYLDSMRRDDNPGNLAAPLDSNLRLLNQAREMEQEYGKEIYDWIRVCKLKHDKYRFGIQKYKARRRGKAIVWSKNF